MSEKTKHEWVWGQVLCLRIKCAAVVNGARMAFRLPEKNGEPLKFVALNGCDQMGAAYDIEVGDRKPFETGRVKDRIKGEVVDFKLPRVDEWVTFINCKISTDIDS